MENVANANVNVGNNIAVTEVELPRQFLHCSRTHLVVLISRMLYSLIQLNDSKLDSSQPLKLTRFHSRVPPSISVYDYLIRLTKYSSLEHCVLLASVYYIDLLSSVFPEFTLDSLTIHRFLITATTVASKGLCDSFCTNTHYAKVGGVQCSELNVLENEFLTKVNYRILPRAGNNNRCILERQERIFSYSNIPNVESLEKKTDNSFNVLEDYYHRMVHLIGNYNSSPDKTCSISFSLEPSKICTLYSPVGDFRGSDHESAEDNEKIEDKAIVRTELINAVNDSELSTVQTDRAIQQSAPDSIESRPTLSPQSNRKRQYSESNMCTKSSISKKHSNTKSIHDSPKEIV
ncbi:HCR001Cp [Eremothecium sinecaudum]|uniref:HCR001Cp n=1 Tax=Eremothecium sinecaudum TaxID=45286 RepID=A0A0X8HRL5_9SACH|nr:HCR001Cp [Eremothecium sinecaudum]AMD20151.1 HCR001Cp [Eremothecium sinecaudum]